MLRGPSKALQGPLPPGRAKRDVRARPMSSARRVKSFLGHTKDHKIANQSPSRPNPQERKHAVFTGETRKPLPQRASN